MRLLTHREKRDSRQDKSSPGRCKSIRQRLLESAVGRLGPQAPWVQRHVAGCPRCQKRLAALTRVDLAISAIKSQPHRLDLLMRANCAAMRMLSHQSREMARAQGLESAKPEPSFLEKCGPYRGAITNVAACVAVLLLTKAGIFSSLDKACTQGQAAMKQYYTTQAGEDLAHEVFRS